MEQNTDKKGWFNQIVDDTLRKEDGGRRRFSRTSLTMFASFVMVVITWIYMLIFVGFRMDVFLTLCGMSLGSKLTDAFGKKIGK
jgi:hypothetical protein